MCQTSDNSGHIRRNMSSGNTSLVARIITALGRLDTTSKIAVACIFLGWFFLDTLVVSVGVVQHTVRFADMSVIAADPTRLFYPLGPSVQRFLFSVICLSCLALVALPQMRRERIAWLAPAAPLALMLLCALAVYVKTSGDFLKTPATANDLGSSVIRLANSLARRGGDIVARHISVAAGGYLALIASAVLAWQAVRRFVAAR
jgi:hypothetical protein